MKLELFILISGLALLCSCASGGYNPHYIISDTSLEEKAVPRLDKEEVQ